MAAEKTIFRKHTVSDRLIKIREMGNIYLKKRITIKKESRINVQIPVTVLIYASK